VSSGGDGEYEGIGARERRAGITCNTASGVIAATRTIRQPLGDDVPSGATGCPTFLNFGSGYGQGKV
jgi:hypothetical protein